MNNMHWSISIVHDLRNLMPSDDMLYGVKDIHDMSTPEINMFNMARNNKFKYDVDFDVFAILATCQLLRHKISVLNRRLQRVRTENKRLQKRNKKLEELLLDYVARQIPD